MPGLHVSGWHPESDHVPNETFRPDGGPHAVHLPHGRGLFSRGRLSRTLKGDSDLSLGMACDYCGGTEDVVTTDGESVCAPCNEAAAAVRRVERLGE